MAVGRLFIPAMTSFRADIALDRDPETSLESEWACNVGGREARMLWTPSLLTFSDLFVDTAMLRWQCFELHVEACPSDSSSSSDDESVNTLSFCKSEFVKTLPVLCLEILLLGLDGQCRLLLSPYDDDTNLEGSLAWKTCALNWGFGSDLGSVCQFEQLAVPIVGTH